MGMVRRIANLLRRGRVDAEIEAELRAHIEMAVEDGVRAGMTEEEARRAARLRFGNPVTMRERTMGEDAALGLESLWRDVKFALRQMRKSPGFAITAVLTLALGIGANTAVFSMVEGVLLRPLPYQHPKRLVVIWQSSPKRPGVGAYFNYYSEFEAWKRDSHSFEKLAALSWATGVRGGPVLWHGKPVNMLALPASLDFFSVLGVRAQMGRTFAPGDLGSRCTVVLSHAFWQQKLGAPESILGQTLDQGNETCRVVGVMPKGFSFYPTQTDAWMLITPQSVFAKKSWDAMTGIFGLLKPGVTRAAAAAELASIQSRMVAEAPADDEFMRRWTPLAISLHDNFTWLTGRNLRRGLWLLLGASMLILLMACVNMGSLLLGRGMERAREMAVRTALGAGRGRLVRQCLTESLLLGMGGTVTGVALALGLLRWFQAANPIQLPPGTSVAMDWCVLAFAALAGVLSSLTFGLLPAWRGSRADPNAALKAGGQAQGQTASAQRAARSLVVVQVALSMLLLAVASLLAESLWRFVAANVGYRTEHLYTAHVQLPKDRYGTAGERTRFAAELAANLASLPQVREVALGSQFLPNWSTDTVTVEGHPEPKNAAPSAEEQDVSGSYFSTLGIRLLRGRSFDPLDRAETQPVAMINEALAKKYFPGTDPVGHAIRMGDDARAPWLTIVGVVGDIRTTTVFQEMGYVEPAVVYRPITQTAPASLALMVATKGSPVGLTEEIQRRLSAMDPGLVLDSIGGLQEERSNDLAQPEFRTVLFGGFAVLALVLALVGLYGVLSQMVVRRRRDIGVRMALGADRERVLRGILRQACSMTLAGAGIGVMGAVAAMHLLRGLLYGIQSDGAGVFACAAGAMVMVALAAAWLPARRAARVDPMEALRSE